MNSVTMRRSSRISVVSGGDEVLWSWPVPKGASLKNVQGEVHVVGPTATLGITAVVSYGFDGWYIPTSDEIVGDFPDHNAMWDELVPKEDNLVELDDDSNADTDPAYEVGESALSAVFADEVFLGPRQIYKRRKLLSFASPQSVIIDPDALGFDVLLVRDTFRVRKRFAGRSKDHGAVLFGFSSPDNTTSGSPSTAVLTPVASGSLIGSLNILRYLGDYLHMAIIDLDSMWEVGAESPWEDMLDMLVTELDKVQGESGYQDADYEVSGVATAQLIVPGSRAFSSIGPDAG